MKLISIIGAEHCQLIPVVYAYKDQITEHLLLADSHSMSSAKRLRRGMERFAQHYQLQWQVTLGQIDEDDIHATSIQIASQIEHSPQEVWLYLGEATPILGHLLGEAVREHGGQMLSYNHQTNKIHFLDHQQQLSCMKLVPRLTLEPYLMLLGYHILSRETRSDLLPHKQSILTLYADQSRFKKLRYALLYPEQNRGFEFGFYRDLLRLLEGMGIVRGTTLISSAQKRLSGDLFEMYVFWLCEALGVDDIAMGVRIDFDDSAQEPLSQRRITNEFDILLMHHNRLYTIECKYSTHLDGLELIYKYDAIIDYFGSHTKAIILNLSSKPKEPYMQSKTSSNFHHSALRRARRANLAIYHETQIHPEKFQALVKSFFELGGE